MKNIQKFVSIIFLAAFVLALVQCSKDEISGINKLSDSKIEFRDNNPCTPDLGGITTCDSATIEMFVQIPMYPGCHFRVRFLLWECKAGSAVAYHLSDYEIFDHDCPQYNTDLQNAMNNGLINVFNIGVGKQIWNSITQWLLNSTSPSFSVVTIEYYVASCAKECYWKLKTGYWVGKRYSCGENCCTLKMVYNKVSGQWQLTNKVLGFPSDPCYGARPVDCPLGRDQWSTDCAPQCEVLNF
ncbi:MAG: hypothetical protein IPH57_01290 [Saprospiraceae bacterium]|nr:hypothetical protein [Saprospiraceae bacterium]